MEYLDYMLIDRLKSANFQAEIFPEHLYVIEWGIINLFQDPMLIAL